eukprot:1375510-Amphidinium_carterae.1
MLGLPRLDIGRFRDSIFLSVGLLTDHNIHLRVDSFSSCSHAVIASTGFLHHVEIAVEQRKSQVSKE